ncbi:MAG: glycosyltransferase [Muribaculum sp.]|nr:glycosyltransferase [Muribaculum sp.]
MIKSVEYSPSFDETEIITVDDGSTDNTSDVIKQIVHAGLNYIYQENQGLSDARNSGISAATGDYIWCIDGDDYITEDAINKIYSLLKQYTPDMLMVEMTRVSESGIEEPNCVQPIQKYVTLSGKQAIINGYYPCSVCSAVIRKNFISENGLRFFTRLYHQDVQFMYRAMALASKVVFTDIRPYVYEIRENSISTSKDTSKIIKRYVDNAVIAQSFNEFASTLQDVELKERIRRHSKMIIIGTIYSLKQEKNQNIIVNTIAGFKKLNLFPIIPPYYTLKHRILSLYLNFKYTKYL